jgi:hypothetical protein
MCDNPSEVGVGKSQKIIQDLQNYDITDSQFIDPKGDKG